MSPNQPPRNEETEDGQTQIGVCGIVDLLVRQPSPRELLEYRPSDDLQALASELLVKQNAGQLTAEERRVLNEIEQFEVFMRLLKAKLRAREVIRV